MFVIMVYDIEVDRVANVLKISRKYLNWVQNSVFEGDIEKASLARLKNELSHVIDKEKDSIIFLNLELPNTLIGQFWE